MFRSKILAVICALLLASPGYAQITMTGAGKKAGTASYTGPGDLATYKGWWGFRAYSAAVAVSGTQKAAKIVKTSSGEKCDFLIATSGDIGNSTACDMGTGTVSLATFCAGGCTIDQWYDQTGNGNHAFGNLNDQLTVSCLNGHPCFHNAGSGYLSTLASTTNQPFSTTFVAERTGGTLSANGILAGASNAVYWNGANTIHAFFGADIQQTASDSAWHVINFSVTGGSGNLNVDGTAATGSVGGNAMDPNFLITAATTAPSSVVTGDVAEGGILATDVSASFHNICLNMKAYYALGATC